jgi:undecaprenyl-diphosphatase
MFGGRIVDAFDRAVDEFFDAHLRGRREIDAVMYAGSALGDHGILWLLIAGIQQVRRRQRGEYSWRPLVRTVTGITIESAVVNGPIKWVFRRSRPVQDGPRPRYLRQPRTSSFPSGHATSAFCAAALLRDEGWWPLYYLAAIIVASSRVHVRIHHASDVVAGMAIGVAMGEVARALMPLPDPDDATPTRESGR